MLEKSDYVNYGKQDMLKCIYICFQIMAAKYIRRLRNVNPDAIQTAIRANPLSDTTVRELKVLAESVVKAPSEKKRHERRTAEGDFNDLIVPLLERVIQENAGNPQGVRVDIVEGFNLFDVSECQLVELIQHHTSLVSQETSLKVRILCVRFQRGAIYRRAHQLITNFEELQDWLFRNFSITYATATAYMSVTSLMERYPILLKSGLSFEQLRRHNRRLWKYLSQQTGVDETCDISDGVSTAAVQNDPFAVHVPDCAIGDVDFELVRNDERQEDAFEFFVDLTEESRQDDDDE